MEEIETPQSGRSPSESSSQESHGSDLQKTSKERFQDGSQTPVAKNEKNKCIANDDENFKDQEISQKKPGKPSQQPNSQEAHVDPGYYTLNPWYGQSSGRGPTFSTAWPFPRTVRPGMLNNLDVENLREQYEQSPQDGEDKEKHGSHKPSKHPDEISLSKAQLDYLAARLSRENAQHKHSDAEENSTPPDISDEKRRPVPRVMPEDENEQTEDISPDVRRESMRPATGVPPQEQSNSKSHHLTPRHQKKNDPSKSPNKQETVDTLRHQASERGHTKPDPGREHDNAELRNRWARIRAQSPEPLAEFVATAISVYIGLAASLSKTTSNGEYGDFHTQSLSWGFGVMFGIYVAGGVSGAHLNPAISITLSLFRGFPWRRCGVYIIAQILGGLVAGAIAFAVYHDAIYNFDPALTPAKSGIALFTIPQPFASISTAFFNEFISGVVLMTVLLALGDDTNAPPGAGMNAFILGLLVTTLIFCSGYQTGLALNPARDFGPRLIALWMGYPRSIFSGYSWWWLWGCWVAPLVGCITGCTVYDTMVFSGGESPLNYRWPSKKEFVRQLRGEGRRVHDHVNAHAKV
ncbi:aquaporin-like protein [Delphinella strobiligena]|nr:aquaporin-like protein [Delphinella strobiligena]